MNLIKDYHYWDVPGSPMAKTPHLQCRGSGLISGQGY